MELFKNRDIAISLISRLMFTLAQQMQSVVLGWQIFERTRDPFALGLIGLSEALPYLAFSLGAGHVADRFEKKRVLILAESGTVLSAVAMALYSLRADLPLACLYAAIGLGGLSRSFWWTAFYAYFEISVPKTLYSRAAAYNSVQWQIGSIAGPLLGGWLLTVVSIPACHAWVTGLCAMGLGLNFFLSPLPPVERATASFWTELHEGFDFVWNEKALLGALSLDLFAVLFGGAVVLMPMFADRFHTGPTGLGWLRAAPSIGALVMAIYHARSGMYEKVGHALIFSVALFGAATLAFAFSPNAWIAFIFLVIIGGSDNVSVIIRASLVQALTPNALRGRVAAINGIFIGSSNEIGAFESGVAARILGLVPSVALGGFLTLMTVAVVTWTIPTLRRFEKSSLC